MQYEEKNKLDEIKAITITSKDKQKREPRPRPYGISNKSINAEA